MSQLHAGKAVFGTLRPVVAGLVVSAAAGLLFAGVWPAGAMSHGLPTTWPDPRGAAIAVAAFLAAARTRLHPALLVVLCGVAGMVLFRGG